MARGAASSGHRFLQFLLRQKLHIEVASGRPRRSGDVPQPGGRRVEGGFSIGECADHFGAAPDLLQDAFQRVIRPDAPPMFGWKAVVGRGVS